MSLSECKWALVLWRGGVKHAGSADVLAGLYNTTPAERRRRMREERGLTLTHTPFWVHESCSWRRRNRSYLTACSMHKSHTQTKWERSWRTRKCVLLWLKQHTPRARSWTNMQAVIYEHKRKRRCLHFSSVSVSKNVFFFCEACFETCIVN